MDSITQQLRTAITAYVEATPATFQSAQLKLDQFASNANELPVVEACVSLLGSLPASSAKSQNSSGVFVCTQLLCTLLKRGHALSSAGLDSVVGSLWNQCNSPDASWAACERLALACALGSLSCHDAAPGAGVAACLDSTLARLRAWNSSNDAAARMASLQCVRAAVSVLEYIVEEARFALERRPPSEAASHFAAGDALSFDRDAFQIRPPSVLTGTRPSSLPAVPGSTPTATLPSAAQVDADRKNTSTVRALAQARSTVLLQCANTATCAVATSRASGDGAVQQAAAKLLHGAIRAVCAWLTCPLVAEVSAADGVTPSGPSSLLSPGAGAPSVIIPVAIDLVQLHRDEAQSVLDIVLFALTRVHKAQVPAREALSKLLHPPSVSASDLRAMVGGMLDGALRELQQGGGGGGGDQERIARCAAMLRDAFQRVQLARQKQAAVLDLTGRAVAATQEAHAEQCSDSSCLAPHVAVGDAVLLALGLPTDSASAAKRRDSVGSAAGSAPSAEQLALNQAQMLSVDLLLNHAPVVLLGSAPQATVVAAAVCDLLLHLLRGRLQGAPGALGSVPSFHGEAQFCGVPLGLSADQCAAVQQQAGWSGIPDANTLWVAVCEQTAVLQACQAVKAHMGRHRDFVLAQYVNAVGSTDATTAETALVAASDILPSLALSADESPFFCSRAAAEMDEAQHPLARHAATLVSAVLGQWTGMLWGSSQFVWQNVAQFFRDSALANGTAPTWMHETLGDALTSLLQHVAPPADATRVLLDTVQSAVAYVRAPPPTGREGSRQLRLAMGMQYLSAACCALRVAVTRLVASTGAGELLEDIETEVAEHGDSITQGGGTQGASSTSHNSVFVSGAAVAAQRASRAAAPSGAVAVVDSNGATSGDVSSGDASAGAVLLGVAEALVQVVHACAESLGGAALGSTEASSLLVAATDALRALQPLHAWCVLSASHLLPALTSSAVEIFCVLWRLQASAVVQSLTHAVHADPHAAVSPRSARALAAARYSGMDSDEEDSATGLQGTEADAARDHPIVSAWLAHAMDAVGERDGDASSAGGPWNHSTSDFAAYALQEGVRGDRDAFVHNLRVCCVPSWTSPASRALDCAADAARSLLEKSITVAVHNGLVGAATVPRDVGEKLLMSTSRCAAVVFSELTAQLQWGMQQGLPAEHGSSVFGVMVPVLATPLSSVVSAVSTAHGWLRYVSGTPAAATGAQLGAMDELLLALLRQLQVHPEETHGSSGSAGSSSVPLPITARVVAVCGLLSSMTSGRAKWVQQHWQAAGAALGVASDRPHPLLSLVSGFHAVWGDVTELVRTWHGAPPALSSYSALLGNILAHTGLAGVRHAQLLRLFVNHLTDVANANPAHSADALRALASAVIAAMPQGDGHDGQDSSAAACLTPAELASMCVATLPRAVAMAEAALLPHLRRAATAAAAAAGRHGIADDRCLSVTPDRRSTSRGGSHVAMATATLREAVALLQAVLSWCPAAMHLASVPGDDARQAAEAAAAALGVRGASLPSVWFCAMLTRAMVHGASLPPVASACLGSSVLLRQRTLQDAVAALQGVQGVATDSADASQGSLQSLLHSAAAMQHLTPGAACPLLPALAAPLARCLCGAAVAMEAATAATHSAAPRDKWAVATHDTCVRFFDGVMACGVLDLPIERCGSDDAVASYVLQGAASAGILLECMTAASTAGAAAGCQPWRRRSSGRGSLARQASVPRMLDRCLGVQGGVEGTARSALHVLLRVMVPGTLLSWRCAGTVLGQLRSEGAEAGEHARAAMQLLCPGAVDAVAAQAGTAMSDVQLLSGAAALQQAAALWAKLLARQGEGAPAGAATALLAVTGAALAGSLATQSMEQAFESSLADTSSSSRGGLRLGGGRRGLQGGGGRRGLRVAVSSGAASETGRIKHASFA